MNFGVKNKKGKLTAYRKIKELILELELDDGLWYLSGVRTS